MSTGPLLLFASLWSLRQYTTKGASGRGRASSSRFERQALTACFAGPCRSWPLQPLTPRPRSTSRPNSTRPPQKQFPSRSVDSPRDKSLPTLTQTLRRLADSSANQKQSVLVTIQAKEQASYERVIDVLSSLHRAQIQNVTFTVSSQAL
ncbi:MAG: ExbD/TolR family protein [Roseimicrobium sp.]